MFNNNGKNVGVINSSFGVIRITNTHKMSSINKAIDVCKMVLTEEEINNPAEVIDCFAYALYLVVGGELRNLSPLFIPEGLNNKYCEDDRFKMLNTIFDARNIFTLSTTDLFYASNMYKLTRKIFRTKVIKCLEANIAPSVFKNLCKQTGKYNVAELDNLEALYSISRIQTKLRYVEYYNRSSCGNFTDPVVSFNDIKLELCNDDLDILDVISRFGDVVKMHNMYISRLMDDRIEAIINNHAFNNYKLHVTSKRVYMYNEYGKGYQRACEMLKLANLTPDNEYYEDYLASMVEYWNNCKGNYQEIHDRYRNGPKGIDTLLSIVKDVDTSGKLNRILHTFFISASLEDASLLLLISAYHAKLSIDKFQKILQTQGLNFFAVRRLVAFYQLLIIQMQHVMEIDMPEVADVETFKSRLMDFVYNSSMVKIETPLYFNIYYMNLKHFISVYLTKEGKEIPELVNFDIDCKMHDEYIKSFPERKRLELETLFEKRYSLLFDRLKLYSEELDREKEEVNRNGCRINL